MPLSFESRPTLTESQVRLIAEAGATVQVGIESLSDHVLQLMNKGVRALENIRLLRWCRACGVALDWNLIFGVPGETDDDYANLIELLPALHYLQPPATSGPVSLDRFSPYHDEPGRYGFTNLRPRAAYSHIYPLTSEDLRDVAPTFEYDSHAALLRSAHRERLRRAVRAGRTTTSPANCVSCATAEGAHWSTRASARTRRWSTTSTRSMHSSTRLATTSVREHGSGSWLRRLAGGRKFWPTRWMGDLRRLSQAASWSAMVSVT